MSTQFKWLRRPPIFDSGDGSDQWDVGSLGVSQVLGPHCHSPRSHVWTGDSLLAKCHSSSCRACPGQSTGSLGCHDRVPRSHPGRHHFRKCSPAVQTNEQTSLRQTHLALRLLDLRVGQTARWLVLRPGGAILVGHDAKEHLRRDQDAGPHHHRRNQRLESDGPMGIWGVDPQDELFESGRWSGQGGHRHLGRGFEPQLGQLRNRGIPASGSSIQTHSDRADAHGAQQSHQILGQPLILGWRKHDARPASVQSDDPSWSLPSVRRWWCRVVLADFADHDPRLLRQGPHSTRILVGCPRLCRSICRSSSSSHL